jgi:hypothetical protein
MKCYSMCASVHITLQLYIIVILIDTSKLLLLLLLLDCHLLLNDTNISASIRSSSGVLYVVLKAITNL